MLSELDRDTIDDILQSFDILYKVMDVRGRIVYRWSKIYINPCYNEDVETLIHEVVHYYLVHVIGVEVPESVVEQSSQDLLYEQSDLYLFLIKYLPDDSYIV